MCSINTLVYTPAAGGRLREPEVGVDRLVPFHSGAGHLSVWYLDRGDSLLEENRAAGQLILVFGLKANLHQFESMYHTLYKCVCNL